MFSFILSADPPQKNTRKIHKDASKPNLKTHQDKPAPAPARRPAQVQRPAVAPRPPYPGYQHAQRYQPYYQHPYNTAQAGMPPMSPMGGACLQQCWKKCTPICIQHRCCLPGMSNPGMPLPPPPPPVYPPPPPLPPPPPPPMVFYPPPPPPPTPISYPQMQTCQPSCAPACCMSPPAPAVPAPAPAPAPQPKPAPPRPVPPRPSPACNPACAPQCCTPMSSSYPAPYPAPYPMPYPAPQAPSYMTIPSYSQNLCGGYSGYPGYPCGTGSPATTAKPIATKPKKACAPMCLKFCLTVCPQECCSANITGVQVVKPSATTSGVVATPTPSSCPANCAKVCATPCPQVRMNY